MLPLAQYLNGHTYFVQHAHTLPNAATPISVRMARQYGRPEWPTTYPTTYPNPNPNPNPTPNPTPTPNQVHMTYQFAEGSKFAYGKRQRLREAGLWLVDEDSYYNGRYITAASLGANLPFKTMGPTVDSRDAVKYHLAEATRRAKIIRALLGIAKVALLTVPLPSPPRPLPVPSLPFAASHCPSLTPTAPRCPSPSPPCPSLPLTVLSLPCLCPLLSVYYRQGHRARRHPAAHAVLL